MLRWGREERYAFEICIKDRQREGEMSEFRKPNEKNLLSKEILWDKPCTVTDVSEACDTASCSGYFTEMALFQQSCWVGMPGPRKHHSLPLI